MNSLAFELNEPRWMEKQFLFIRFQCLASPASTLTIDITQVMEEWGEEGQWLLQ